MVLMTVTLEKTCTIADELAARVTPATLIRRDEPLAKHTTMRIGGPADVYVEPASEADLAVILKFCSEREIKFFLLGRGSNLLVRDGGFRGVVICLAHESFSRIEIDGERLRCGAGAKLKNVAVEAKRNNLSGVEFLEGIPGSVGGALRMNAGAMGAVTFGAVESLRFMDQAGKIYERAVGEVPVEYRTCALLKNHIALGAVFRGKTLPRAEIEKRMLAFSEKRWESQPAAPSAGCIFKNPAGGPSAGELIVRLGLKGSHAGGAAVHARHANVIVNRGNATAADVLVLMQRMRAAVRGETGILLDPEVVIVGEDPAA